MANGYGPCMQLVNVVAEGVLFAAVTPSRVVALVERGGDGR